MLPVALGDGGDTLLATCGKDGAKRQEEKDPPRPSLKGREIGDPQNLP